MKRNETVLVYAVTGLLLVILLIAVIFGDQGAVRADETKQAGKGGEEQLLDLPGVSVSDPEPGGAKEGGEGKITPYGPEGSEGTKPNPKTSEVGGEPNSEEVDLSGPGEIVPANTEAKTGSEATPSEPPLALSAKVQLERKYGTSRRVGEYRTVDARPGDSLRKLVAKWCGDVEKHLPVAVALNESVVDGRLALGQEVMVPWVPDEVLLTAMQQRAELEAKLESAKGELYTLKKGDVLWRMAGKRVASNKIPKWIEEFRRLNPEITDTRRMVPGQKVRLPKKAKASN